MSQHPPHVGPLLDREELRALFESWHERKRAWEAIGFTTPKNCAQPLSATALQTRAIWLTNRGLRDEGVASILPERARAAEAITLASNAIGDAGIQSLLAALQSGALPHLERIDLSGNPASRVAKDALRAALAARRPATAARTPGSRAPQTRRAATPLAPARFTQATHRPRGLRGGLGGAADDEDGTSAPRPPSLVGPAPAVAPALLLAARRVGDVGGGDVGGSKGGVDETCGRARGSQMTVCIAMRCRREEVGEGAIPGMRVEIARAEVIRLR